ncbi:uncharacterized protein LOC135698339 isoform X2 [Ochlerotatus camptorhynchus]|uniref:uncharacterized protein LOC135698339 isoform X2 n=1 Tax=Ochlerotatus camptorhynchus TaxID=644619 RepID=UPI0031E45732
MSVGYRNPSEVLDLSEQNGKTIKMEEKASFFHRAASAKHFSVRKLVHQFESRASDRFERISGRFSSKGWKAKHAKRDAEANRAGYTSTTAAEQQDLSKALWYLPSDKITEDNEACEPIEDALKEEPFPDVSDICDCYNEFIYLQLSKEKADYLNSNDSDYEEDYCESFAEACNMIISLQWPGDYVHYIVHGYHQSREKEQSNEADDGFSESDDSVFFEAEEAPLTSISEIDLITIKDPDKVDGNSTKLAYLIEELLETERNYINILEKGISTYINNVFDTIPIPVQLVNMKYHLFGNIEYIHQFHKSILLPKLTACGKDVTKVAQVFCKYLENDSFYGYVLYSLYNPKSQRLCVQFARFFEDHQNYSGDKLGVKSLILQPIQRLPRYRLLLASMVKVLQSNGSNANHESSIQLDSVLKAEQLMEKFITTQNESMAVNDIVECEKTEDDEVELGFGVPKPATVLREQNSENQILFLYPRDSENLEKCKPINILHQGKFKKVFLVFFNDLRLGRQYQGKLFIFERCVIYTEQLKLKTLSYRGHFDHHEVCYDFSNLQILKIFSEKDEHHSIEVKINIQNPEAASLATIVELLRSIISKRKKKESFIIESTELTIIRNSVLHHYNSNRSSLSSVSSGFSYYNTCGQNCSDEITSIDNNSQLANNTDELDQMVSYHQYYEKALKDSIYFYIYSLPNDVRQQLLELSEILEEILKMQQKINYRLFEESLHQNSELNLTHFCDTFHDSLRQSEFDVYLRYVERSKSAEAVLMSFEQYFTGLPREENVIFLSIDAFLLLPVEFINRCYEFFEGIHNDVHDAKGEVILRNTVLDYKIHYVHSQLSLLRQRINENYYIRQLIMDVDFLNEIELVQYSEIVKLEGSYASYRLFLMKPGLLCLKIKQDMQGKPETYSSVTFYCPYIKTTARNSHRSGKRWSVYLDGRKTTLIFRDKQKRYVLNERYTTLAEQMRAKVRVKKVSFFRALENMH